ncbi:hypothetical protein Tco_1301619 [Tanacetum coccineum]
MMTLKFADSHNMLQALVDGKKIVVTEASVRRDLQLEDANGVDCLPNATIFEQLTLMGYEKLSQKLTFYKAFFSPQWKFLIHTILQCLSAKTTAWNEFSSTMASAIICLANNQKFNFSKYIFENMMKNLDSAVKFLMYPRFVQVFLNNQLEGMATHNKIYIAPSHTKNVFANMKRQGKDFSGRVTPLFLTMVVQAPEDQGEDEAVSEENVSKHFNDLLLSGEDKLKLQELMTLCTNLQNRVLDLEHTKTTQALEIDSLKRRVKKLEKKQRSRTHELRILYKGRKINDIDKDADITLVDETQGRYDDDQMFDVSDLACEEDKGKGKMVEPKKPLKKKDQISFDKETAKRLQAEFDEEARLAREKDEANVALTEEWNDIQAKIKANQLLAERLQAREQEELTIEEMAKLFQQLLEKRRKHFTAKRAEEKRNIPPTKAQ